MGVTVKGIQETSRQKKNDEEKYSQPQTIARPADEEKTSSPDKDNKEN